jgi:K+-sensing histidine kinase KdpD
MSVKEKSVEELLRENVRLRGDLLTIAMRISHDLRTPLGSIVNTAELLKEILAEKNIPTAPLYSLFASVDESTRLIKSLSLLAKASAHPLPLQKVKMSDAVYRAWQRLERQISKSSARVDIADSWPEIFGVNDWLEFVWSQFLSNAVRHGGKQIEMGWHEENSIGKFFVRDSGKEIPAERNVKLFQPFEELHLPNAARGIGLAMSRRLIEMQNGKCGYEFDGGSIFYFTLPLVETNGRCAEAAQRIRSPHFVEAIR